MQHISYNSSNDISSDNSANSFNEVRMYVYVCSLSKSLSKKRLQFKISHMERQHTVNTRDIPKDGFYEQLGSILGAVPWGDVKLLLGDLNAQIGEEGCFFLTIGKHRLYVESKFNGTRVANFA